MKKHFLLFLLCLATNASLTAQETLRENNGEPTLVERLSNGEIKINSAEMNFQLFTSANAEFVGKELSVYYILRIVAVHESKRNEQSRIGKKHLEIVVIGMKRASDTGIIRMIGKVHRHGICHIHQ